LLCGLAVLAGGCVARSTQVTAPSATPGKYGTGVKFGTAAPTRQPGKTRTIVRTEPEDEATAVGPPPTYSRKVQIDQSSDKINDDGEPGANTHLYLNRKVPKLIVEIDAVRGWEPSPGALRMLRDRLTQIVDKPEGVVFLPTQVIPRTEPGDSQEPFYVKTEKKYRSRHSTRAAIVLYVLYADGDSGNVIGAAYSSSAIVMFKQTIVESAATPLVSAQSIENSVIVHEAGHILALVNIGYKSPRDHEDPEHDHHSKNENSVMYWAVDNVGVAALLGGRKAPPTVFDAADLADLRDLRDGKLK
jgi:hypothetical protein